MPEELQPKLELRVKYFRAKSIAIFIIRLLLPPDQLTLLLFKCLQEDSVVLVWFLLTEYTVLIEINSLKWHAVE